MSATITLKDSPVLYYGSQISDNLAETPEGFLICMNVPICRTGSMVYAAQELMVDSADPFELIPVYRTEDEVFATNTLASFEGKPITEYHPNESVSLQNYSNYAKGTVMNVRRGVGADSDKILADLMVTDASLIERIRSKDLREVSCGYSCQIEFGDDGQLFQRAIRGNHVAVVTRGRAGSDVAIKDEEPNLSKGRRKKAMKRKRQNDADSRHTLLEQFLTNSFRTYELLEDEAEKEDTLAGMIEALVPLMDSKTLVEDQEVKASENNEEKEVVMDTDAIMGQLSTVVSDSIGAAMAPIQEKLDGFEERLKSLETKDEAPKPNVQEALDEIREMVGDEESKVVSDSALDTAVGMVGSDLYDFISDFATNTLGEDKEAAFKLVDGFKNVLKAKNKTEVEDEMTQVLVASDQAALLHRATVVDGLNPQERGKRAENYYKTVGESLSQK